jgi:hypothetical protein
MFERVIGIGMVCGLVACATEQNPRADEPDLGKQRSTAEQDGAADQRPLPRAQDAAASPRAPARADSSVTDGDKTSAAYPGTGFVVHEWGTNTVVVSSEGKLLRGMHHEEEDLPAFVYDRLSQGEYLSFPSVDKMETPVDYFYADRPLTAKVSVSMPNGLLTQWYPAVSEFAPSIVEGGFGRAGKFDPHLELGLPFESQRCIDKFTSTTGGRLDWGDVEILARDAELSPTLPEAPLEHFTWSYARDVAANPVRVRNPSRRTAATPEGEAALGPESERFLFYRGLGNFALPAEVVPWGSGVTITNRSPWPLQGSVFVLNVAGDTGAFRKVDGLLAPGAELITEVTPADALPLDGFVDALDAAMTTALLGTGLYRDEAVAMVRTWRRQWFRTLGLRVLHFAPAAWIDHEVPLSISPTPDTLLRVMVLRIELLPRSTEDEDLKFVAALDGGEYQQAGERHFRALGRFAEPRLRRALENLGSVPPGAVSFLAGIEHPNASFALGE